MNKRSIATCAIVFVFCWLLWADYGNDIARFFTDGTASGFDGAGSWGDSFGPFTAAVSALGTVFVLMTLSQQRKAVREQADDLYRQRFESSF